ncbi:MAG: extracellular solute-binding protein [Blautia sp.]|nr:extracellular solute-binding protein [Blautia sp.]
MRKNIAKGLGLLLSLSLSLSGLAVTANAGETETITLLSWYSDQQLGSFISEFEAEYPNIHVDLQFVPPVQQYVDKFSVLVASNQMTDMFYTAAENKQEVAEKGLAEDLSDMEIFSRIDKNTASTYGSGDEIYAYSPDAWIGGVFYNKTLFEEAGIEGEPATWEEFIDACQKLMDLGVIPYVDDADNVHNLAQDLYQCTVISQDPDVDHKINAGEATYAEYYTEPLKKWYDTMVTTGLYSPISLGMNSDQIFDMFAMDQVAMVHGGPWNVATIEDKNPDMEYGIFGIADSDGNRVLPGALNVGMSISTSTTHHDACRTFLEFMQREENILKWQEITGNAIIVEGVDYSMDTCFEAFKEDAVAGNFYLPQIVWKNSSGIYKEFLTGIQDVLTGADTIENIPVRLDEKQAELSR